MAQVRLKSLRTRFLTLLALGGSIVASAGLWVTYTTTVGHFEAQLIERGTLLADTLNHSAMVADTSMQVQHVVDELSRSPHIRNIIVVAGQPPEIMASSNHRWNGMRLDQLPDRHLGEHLLGVLAQENFGHHFDEEGESLVLTAPLEQQMADHQRHDDAMMMSNAMPARVGMDHGRMPESAPGHDMASETAPDPIPIRGAIMLTLDNKEALSAISQILWLLCLALLAAVLITMSIAYVLVDRQILARLNLIRRAMTRQESIDAATQATMGANDEISDLGRAFNSMIDRIGTETKRRESVVKKLLDSEERFQSFAEIGSDWMWEMDSDLRYSYFSEPTHRMTGLPQEHYLGKTKIEAGQGIADEAAWQQHLADLEAHRPFRDFCYSIADAGGCTSHWSISGTPVFDANGDFKGYRGIGSDISERKATEEAMLAAMREAEIANRTKSEFLANMSHELRTPLNAIIGFSDIIKDERLGPIGSDRYRDYAADINDSGQHLLALINNILDLSKIESGTDELCEESIDIPAVAHSLTRLLTGLAQANNVRLELDVPDDIPLLHADERKVKQILLNLLSNAIKFTPGGGTVTLKIWTRAKSGYIFQVIDTGVGIAFEDIPRALAPFQQIDSGLNRKHEGTGLGLPLAKSLVEMHSGYLDLQSEVGVGTTVTVRFPAERIAHATHAIEAASDESRKAS